MKTDDLPKRIEVHAYSGYKADERPTAFTLDEQVLQVSRIMDRWYGVEHDYFKILADDGAVYLIRRHRILDLWFLVKVMPREGKHEQAAESSGSASRVPGRFTEVRKPSCG